MADATTEPPAETPLSAEEVFDAVGPAYEAAFEGLPEQKASVDWLLAQLKAAGIHKGRIVDIGCGTGKPVVSSLAAAGHSVLGIDISGAMIASAKEHVTDPNASFEQTDVRKFLESAAKDSYDAVTVYFSMIASVTQQEIKDFIHGIHAIVKPGGFFVFATVPLEAENMQIKWMGRPVVVSSLAPEQAVAAVKDAGFTVEHEAVTKFTPKGAEAGICQPEDVWEEPHLFVYAKKAA